MNYLTLSDEEVEEIGDKHVRSVDKFYRMFSGLSSELTGVKNGILYLEITISPRWNKTIPQTVAQLITSWKTNNKILQDTIGCEVTVFNSYSLPGFVLHPQDIGTPYAKKLIAQYNANDEKNLIYIYKERMSSLGLNTKIDKSRTVKQVEITDTFYFPEKELNLLLTFEQKHISNGIFELSEKNNYIILNTSPGSNILLKPNTESTYIAFITESNGLIVNKRLLPASTTPMLYTLHDSKSYLVNISTVTVEKDFLDSTVFCLGEGKIW